MRNPLISAGKMVGIAAILISAFLPIGANAQTATNQAKSALTPELATSYWRECYEEENKTDVLSCKLVKDGVTTTCTKDLAAAAGDKCVFTYPDSSRIEADPNLTMGATFRNYNSEGDLVGTTDTAPGGAGEGTLAESAGYDDGSSCGTANLGCWLQRLPGMLFSAIGYVSLLIASGILYIAGTVFNWVVIRTVFQFGTYFGTSEGMLIAWGVMRDISNIALLFGFILMGVLLILNVEGGGGHGHGGGISAKKAIPRLIIFAVLLNFSLFASQAVIDVSNAFSASFATLAGESCTEATSSGDTASGGQAVSECANVGISGRILEVAGISRIWDVESFEQGMSNLTQRPYSYSVSLILLSLFVFITAVVLLAGAIMLIARVVILSLLMVTSPIGFAGMVVPKMQGIASMWWSKLISQSFFAPVYLLLIFISIKLSENLMTTDASLANALIGNQGNTVAGNMQVVMVFLIVIGFMIGSLIAASKMGAMGASFATNSASALVFGAAARGTNFVVGGGANYLRKRVQGSRLGDTAAGRVLVNRGLRPLQNANLDLRRLPGVAGGLGLAGISAGAKPAEHAAYGDIAHQFSDIKAGKGSAKLTAEYEEERKTSLLEQEAHDESEGHGLMSADSKQFLASLSTKELEQLHGIKEGLSAMAQNLSPEQFGKLMDGDKLTDAEKGALKAGRFKALNAAAISNTPTAATDVKDIVKAMSKKDLENAPSSVLLQPLVLDSLSDTQRDELGKSDKRSPAEKTAIKASYASEVLKKVYAESGKDASAVVTNAKFATLSTAQFAELGANILKEPAVAAKIPPTVLTKIQKDNKLSPAEMKDVGAVIRAQIQAGNASSGMDRFMSGPNGDFWS